MAYLSNPTETKAVLDMFGFSFAKKYGQNFLIDGNIVSNIVKNAGITKEDTVLEIGPGIGTMTQVLCEQAKNVIAVEIDKRLIDVLTFTLRDYDNVTVINSDILKCNIEELCKQYSSNGRLKVVANLPYYITTPIIMELLEKNNNSVIESITVMIQKEVAQRLCAAQGSADGGAFSLFLQYYMETELLFDVPREKFLPAPKVTSAVIRCVRRSRPAVEVEDADFFFRCVRAAFVLRRKTLANSLAAGLKGFDKAAIQSAIEAGGWSPSVRGEQLTLSDFARLAQLLRSAQA